LADNQTDKKIVTFDGKTLKGSFDRFNDKKAIQILSAFTDKHIILAHEEIDTKTNEIPTTQELIVKLGLSNCVFTLDAIHCQEETLEVANKTGNDVIVQVKKNQKTLFNDCQKTAETTIIADEYTEPTTKERNRIESRNVQVFANNLLITHTDKWQLVKAIIKVYRKREVFNAKTKLWKESNETSFYISTTYLDAKTFCQSIRNHWGIENKNHYVKDVTMLEDKSRIRINPNIFAKLRSFALNIIRANNVENVNLELYNNCMKLNKVLNYFGVKEN
jgi:predicted transposase YbfD/YdcC